MRNQTKYYNDLIPPKNPEFPWTPDDWQLLCYYCAQPIYETKAVAAYRQRTCYMRGQWLHSGTNESKCTAKIRPDNEIDDPRCHCCNVQELPHQMFCSVCGPPYFSATPMSHKEDELIRIFGWQGRN